MAKKPPYTLPTSTSSDMGKKFLMAKRNRLLEKPQLIPLSLIEFDPNNPRKLSIDRNDLPDGPNPNDELYQKKLKDYEEVILPLVLNIKKIGLTVPVVVFPYGNQYRLISGECRCLASIAAGETEIKAFVRKDISEYKRVLIRHAENNLRNNLNLYERLKEIQVIYETHKKTINESVKFTVPFIQDVDGCSERKARNILAILNGPAVLMGLIEEKKLTSLEAAASIAVIKNTSLQKKLFKILKKSDSLSISQIKKIINGNKASLKLNQELDKVITEAQITGKKTYKLRKKPGPQASRVNMGYTKNIHVIKTICESILNNSRYSNFKKEFTNIRWENISDCTQAFKKIIALMETVEVN